MYQIGVFVILPIASMSPRTYDFLTLEDGVTPIHLETSGVQSGGALEIEPQ